MWCCAVSDHRDFSDAYDEVIDEPHRTKDAEEGVSIIPDSDDRGADSAINWVDMSNWDNEPVPQREWAIRDGASRAALSRPDIPFSGRNRPFW